METSERDIISLRMSRSTAVAAFGALSMAERASDDPEVTTAVKEFMQALIESKIEVRGI